MSFEIAWVELAASTYQNLESTAKKAFENRKKAKKKKTSKQEGLFKQIRKTIQFLANNPKHPSLNTHEFDSIPNPYNSEEKVFEVYAQNNTPSAYRVFWCYGPDKKQITIIHRNHSPPIGNCFNLHGGDDLNTHSMNTSSNYKLNEQWLPWGHRFISNTKT